MLMPHRIAAQCVAQCCVVYIFVWVFRGGREGLCVLLCVVVVSSREEGRAAVFTMQFFSVSRWPVWLPVYERECVCVCASVGTIDFVGPRFYICFRERCVYLLSTSAGHRSFFFATFFNVGS